MFIRSFFPNGKIDICGPLDDLVLTYALGPARTELMCSIRSPISSQIRNQETWILDKDIDYIPCLMSRDILQNEGLYDHLS